MDNGSSYYKNRKYGHAFNAYRSRHGYVRMYGDKLVDPAYSDPYRLESHFGIDIVDPIQDQYSPSSSMKKFLGRSVEIKAVRVDQIKNTQIKSVSLLTHTPPLAASESVVGPSGHDLKASPINQKTSIKSNPLSSLKASYFNLMGKADEFKNRGVKKA